MLSLAVFYFESHKQVSFWKIHEYSTFSLCQHKSTPLKFDVTNIRLTRDLNNFIYYMVSESALLLQTLTYWG